MNEVLSFFDYTTNMVKPWWKLGGYNCICYDQQHMVNQINEGLRIVGGDILTFEPRDEQPKICFFFPPCTNVAVSGARWFKGKGLPALIETLQLFNKCIEIAEHYGAPYMIENPVSTISTYWRKPDYIFDPWQYGDNYTKKTCLWTGYGFKMPEPSVKVKPDDADDRIHKAPPSPERANFRSATPMGFAQAVFKANRNDEPS